MVASAWSSVCARNHAIALAANCCRGHAILTAESTKSMKSSKTRMDASACVEQIAKFNVKLRINAKPLRPYLPLLLSHKRPLLLPYLQLFLPYLPVANTMDSSIKLAPEFRMAMVVTSVYARWVAPSIVPLCFKDVNAMDVGFQ